MAADNNNRTRPWGEIHDDFKLTRADGTRMVLVWVDGAGTCLVPWEGATTTMKPRRPPDDHR